MIRGLILTLLISLPSILSAQLVQGDGGTRDESELYAATKQVNQFFRRFNGEEDQKGNRYYKGDKEYRKTSLRKKYLSLLFDNQNQNIPKARKKKFIEDVTNQKHPQYLDFHKGKWFAEVRAIFTRNGQEESFLLFFKIQKERQGYEWVLDQVASEAYPQYFDKDSSENKPFLHPMSHELDFMNLHKVLNQENAVNFTANDFEVDPLSIFLYELSTGQLHFKTVTTTKFHFFQCEGWYFKIAEYNRKGYNSGWLISDLTPIARKDVPKLKSFIYEAQ